MSMRTLPLIALLALAGCDKGAAPAGGEKSAEAKPADPAADFGQALAAVNAARPAGATVEFETQKIDKDTIVAAVPKGWKAGVIPGSFKPADEANLGFMTSYSVGSNCDGSCEPKDWPAVAEKVDLGQFRDAERFELVEEVPLTAPTGKLIVAKAKGESRTYLSAARWKDGANKYFTCRATLDGDTASALLPAFKTACSQNLATFLK
jgi:hypothetical protein